MASDGKKIIRLGLSDLVISLHNQGYSARKIAEIIRRTKGFEVSDQTVRNFLRTKKVIENIGVEEAISEIQRSLNIEGKVKVYEELIASLLLTNQLIDKTFTDGEISESKKTFMIDKLNRTKTLICRALTQYHAKIDLLAFLNEVFNEISLQFSDCFRTNNLDEDTVRGIVDVLQKVFKKFENKIKVMNL